MSASRRYVNTKSFVFEIDGGATVTLTGKTRFGFDYRGNVIEFSGDGDRFPTTSVNDYMNPQMTIDAADVGTAQALTPGIRGTATAVVADAKNVTGGVGSGELSIVMSNAIVNNNSMTSQHRQFGTTTITMTAESADGLTNPVAVTVA
jgi:hypothetical protein